MTASDDSAACPPPCADPVLDVRGLKKRFGQREAVRGVDIAVCPGEIFGFLGPNGSGKTTTMRMLCGLLTPDAGEGHALGHDIIRESRRIRLHVGYMTQHFSLYADLTVRENLLFAARVHGLPSPARKVEESIRDLGLEPYANELAGHLSGGWKQRLALAASTLHEPRLLLLDEPTSGVDPAARRRFWDDIHALARRGMTVLVSTHYMDEAERCHRLAWFYRGRILACGSVDDIIAASGLVALEASGAQAALAALEADVLQALPGAQCTWMGDRLHISVPRELRERVIALCREHDAKCESARPRMEDVFIHLVHARESSAGGERSPEEAS